MAVTFIGGGNMATALIGGLLARGEAAAGIRVVEPLAEQRERLRARFPGIAVQDAVDAACGAVDLVVLCVKPQQMHDAVRPLVPFLGAHGPGVLTIAAGIRLADLSRWLGGYERLARAMPNMPALIGRGIAGLYALPQLEPAAREAVARVLAAGGEVVWVKDEAMLDAVTGVSGSGPAYVFYFLEALESAARDVGFDAADARKLAYATVDGAIALAQSSDAQPAALRAQVTSKGGTTERGIASMDADGVARAIRAAVRAATDRARELGDAFGRDA
jgi:pyrroline-5-carboxylate reductase